MRHKELLKKRYIGRGSRIEQGGQRGEGGRGRLKPKDRHEEGGERVGEEGGRMRRGGLG